MTAQNFTPEFVPVKTDETKNLKPAEISVGYVTQWCHPEPARIVGSVIRSLTKRRARVSVYTGIPHYPTGNVTAGYKPWLPTKEEIGGTEVHRYPEYPYRGSSPIGRLIGYGSFALSASLGAVRHLREKDVVLVYSSPATAAIPAMLARLLFRTPYVLHVQDIWPDSVMDSNFINSKRWARFVYWALSRFVSLTYRYASAIVCICPGAASLLESRGVPRSKLITVYNWLDEQVSQDIDVEAATPTASSDFRCALGIPRHHRVYLYAGNFGPAQGLIPLAQGFLAAELGADHHLVFLGDGVSRPEIEEIAMQNRNVHVRGRVSVAEAAALIRGADVSIVSLSSEPLYEVTFPSKIQSIASAGRPILGIISGDAARFIAENGAGIVGTPGSQAAIADAFKRMAKMDTHELEKMGASAHLASESTLSEKVGGDALLRTLVKASRKR
jgi:colanic acid biosynthesis glycosyl transferase WcaI